MRDKYADKLRAMMTRLEKRFIISVDGEARFRGAGRPRRRARGGSASVRGATCRASPRNALRDAPRRAVRASAPRRPAWYCADGRQLARPPTLSSSPPPRAQHTAPLAARAAHAPHAERRTLRPHCAPRVAHPRPTLPSSSSHVPQSLPDLRIFDRAMCDDLVARPMHNLAALEAQLRDSVLDLDADYFHKVARHHKTFLTQAALKAERICVGLEGDFGARLVSPRSLMAEHLSSLVCLEGIVTRCSVVRPKMARSVQFCPMTGDFQTREFRDATDLGGAGPTGSNLPSKDDKGNKLELEFGLSTFKDSQSFAIQEMPEAAPLGQLPRSVDVLVEGDLVDIVKPGDRIACTGLYRALTSVSAGGDTDGMFRTVLLANHIRRLGKDSGRIALTPKDVANIKAIAGDSRSAFDRMVRDAAFLDQARRENLEIDFVSGEELQRIVAEIVATPKPIADRLTEIIGGIEQNTK